MQEVAAGYVSLFPKFASGFKDAIASEIGGAGTQGGTAAGGGFKSTFLGVLAGNVMTSVVSKIAGSVKAAFGGGFDRLMNIEQAEIKLKTLGIDVQAAMKSVGTAVDGTKFAISDAADMAAFLGASGVAAGEDMTKWLSRTADAAQFTNRPFADMQRTLSKVVAEGRVTGETFQELPLAAAALADHLGISQQEVRKLASQGKISAEQLGEALDAKIGGAAKNAGASFLSLRDNIRTAMNATMANLLKPFVNAAMPIMTAWLGVMKGFRDNIAKPIGELIGSVLQPKAEALARFIERIPAAFAGLRDLIVGGDFTAALSDAFGWSDDSGIVAAILRIRDAFLGLRTLIATGDFTGALSNAFGWSDDSAAVSGILRVRDAFIGLRDLIVTGGFSADLAAALGIDQSSRIVGVILDVRAAILDMWTTATGAVSGLGGFQGVLATIAPFLGLLLGPLGGIVAALRVAGPAFLAAAEGGGSFTDVLTAFAASAVSGIGDTITNIVATAAQLIPMLAQVIVTVLPTIISGLTGALSTVASVLTAMLPGLVSTLTGSVTAILTELVSILPSYLPMLLDSIISILMGVITAVTTIAPALVAAVIDLVSAVVQLIPTLLPALMEAALRLFDGLVMAVPQVLQPLLQGLLELVMTLAQLIPTLIPVLLEAAIALFMALVAAIPTILVSLIDAVLQLIMALTGMLPSLIPVLLVGAIGLFTALVDALPVILPALLEGVVSIIMAVVGMLPSLIEAILGAAVTLFTAIVKSLPIILPALLSGVLNLIGSVITLLPTLIGRLLTTAVTLFMAIVDAVPRVVGSLIGAVTLMINQVISTISGAGGRLLESGRALIGDFVAGIRRGFDNAVNAVKDGLTRVRNFFPFSPAKEGPFSGSGYTTHSGRKLMDDFAAAILSEEGTLRAATSKVMSAAALTGRVETLAIGSSATGGATSMSATDIAALVVALRQALDGLGLELVGGKAWLRSELAAAGRDQASRDRAERGYR